MKWGKIESDCYHKESSIENSYVYINILHLIVTQINTKVISTAKSERNVFVACVLDYKVPNLSKLLL